MVKMLISEFGRVTGLGADTIRYYVRLGLFSPEQGTRGGRNPYQEFSADDVHVADVVKVGQMLGMSLKEIAALLASGDASQLDFLRQKSDSLRSRGEELLRLSRYLDQKVAWIVGGERGASPTLGGFTPKNDDTALC